ncbi:MAG: hypothetical protein ACYCS7_10470 [Acidimicrobiales bacterium]
MGQAAEAAIAAGDVIGYANLGERSASSDHQAALDVLLQSRVEAELLDDLRWLLAQKNPAQHTEDWAGDRVLAEHAFARAQRLVHQAGVEFARADEAGWPQPAPAINPLVAEVKRLHAR